MPIIKSATITQIWQFIRIKDNIMSNFKLWHLYLFYNNFLAQYMYVHTWNMLKQMSKRNWAASQNKTRLGIGHIFSLESSFQTRIIGGDLSIGKNIAVIVADLVIGMNNWKLN